MQVTGFQLEGAVISILIDFFGDDADRIGHALKVHSFAKAIAVGEGIAEGLPFDILNVTALLHDVGIKPSIEKYGTCTARMQEEEGALLIPELLGHLNPPQELIDRVCHIVGHHHTYGAIDSIDFRILVEADYLVNHREASCSRENAEAALDGFFRTATGTRFLRKMYL